MYILIVVPALYVIVFNSDTYRRHERSKCTERHTGYCSKIAVTTSVEIVSITMCFGKIFSTLDAKAEGMKWSTNGQDKSTRCRLRHQLYASHAKDKIGQLVNDLMSKYL